MQREYAASYGRAFPPKAVTHAIAGDFDYSHIDQAKTLCGRSGPFSTNHNMNSDVEITCQTCKRVDAKPARPKRSRASR